MQQIRIVSRTSQLALWQANYVKEQLLSHYPQLAVEIIGVTTLGDRILDRSLDKIGGKGLFIKELEYQLLQGIADIAVHSLKDLPVNLADTFTLAAILKRGNPYDAFVSNKYNSLEEIPSHGVIGTSSARRTAIIKKYYPQLQVKLLRGNVNTRLNKLDNGEFDAIILAVAGLQRLQLDNRIKQILLDDKFIPAIGQGALAVEICSNRNDLAALVGVLDDKESRCLVMAEREIGHFLNASCNVPIAGFAKLDKGKLRLNALFADPESAIFLQAEVVGELHDYIKLARECAHQLLKQDVTHIIDKYSLAVTS